MIYCEFVSPPRSGEIIYQAEIESIPRYFDMVYIKDKYYRVHSVEWHDHHPLGYENKMSVVINLQPDEVEDYYKNEKGT